MIIDNVAASFPSRKVNNEEVVDLIRFHSASFFEGDLEKTLRIVKTLLDRSGLVHRHWCAPGEKPIDHLALAVRQALEPSSIQPAQIDLLVYVGIGGGFREPGNSYMAAKALGCHNAQCFDVIDACMSWTRAMSLVDSLFKTGPYRNALIVNAEFNMAGSGPLFLPNFVLKHREQLKYTMPTFTIGEAATATLLLPHKPENFRFSFHSKPELTNLCMIPRQGYEGFYGGPNVTDQLGVDQFTAFGSEMNEHLKKELPEVLQRTGIRMDEVDIIFTHTSSLTEWQSLGESLGIAEKISHVYQNIGNVVSASIPAAMSIAKLNKGTRILSLMGSAGMSFCVNDFTF
jgi:3-oxoacyl-[acyl-carrier-protein] synthase III